jgi:branched-chain amino acid transport system ATP-binding protein
MGQASADIVIETRRLTKAFGSFTAVRDLDLRVRRGTIHALIGPNGAGKTTVFNLVTGFLAPSSGQIIYEGRDVTGVKPAALAREGVVRSFQISAVFPGLSARDNIRIALQQPTGVSYRFWQREGTLAGLHRRCDELLDTVGLVEDRSTVAGELSYGKKRALELATTLALEPRVMLLDEPMAGLGHEDIGRIADLIRRVSAARTVLMVEHNLAVVESLSDTITVLTRGQVLAEGAYPEVSANPAVLEAYMGTGHA